MPIQVTNETKVDGDTVGTFSRISKYLEQHYPKGAEVDIVFEVRHGGNGEMENIATSIQRK